MIELRPATAQDISEFATWQYMPPYDVHNIDMSTDEAVAYFLEPNVHCHTLFDGDVMVGYCTFGSDAQVPGGDYDIDGIDIGLGVKPERTGSGRGIRFVTAVVDHARESFESLQLRVTIAAGNSRACRVWGNAGFSEISRFATERSIMGSSEFVILSLFRTDAA
jgi:RimJ/RimL family protein N-acetyltransferase